MISSALSFAALLACGVSAKPSHTTEVDAATTRPWYVHAASQEIVNFCFFGMDMGMFGGHYSTVNGGAPMASITSVSETVLSDYESSTATTIVTTVDGGEVTVYGDAAVTAYPVVNGTLTNSTITTSADDGSDDAATATPDDDSDDSDSDGSDDETESTPVTTFFAAPTTSTLGGLKAEVERIESYAHALAEALIAPREMTRVLRNAYNLIDKHGFIHATDAVELLSQASHGMKALHTDPAYKQQRANLLAQPTPINYKKAVSKARAQHTNGVQKLLAEPSGHHVLSMAKDLGDLFLKDFTK